MAKYGLKEIAAKLDMTALNDGYHGNELYVARDLPFLSKEEKGCLTRYLIGNITSTDHIRLQEIAIKIREFDKKSA